MDEWQGFHTQPGLSRFRAVTGSQIQLRPLWHRYNPLLAFDDSLGVASTHMLGHLPACRTLSSFSPAFIPVDRGGACFELDEVGLGTPFVVEGGRLFAIRDPPVTSSDSDEDEED